MTFGTSNMPITTLDNMSNSMWDDPFDVTADGLRESDKSSYGATAPAQSRAGPAA